MPGCDRSCPGTRKGGVPLGYATLPFGVVLVGVRNWFVRDRRVTTG